MYFVRQSWKLNTDYLPITGGSWRQVPVMAEVCCSRAVTSLWRCLGLAETLFTTMLHLKTLFLVELWFTGLGQHLSFHFWCHIIWLNGESCQNGSVPSPNSGNLCCPSADLPLHCPGSPTVTPRYPQLKRHPAISMFFKIKEDYSGHSWSRLATIS